VSRRPEKRPAGRNADAPPPQAEINGRGRVLINSDRDIVTARQQGRALAHEAGFSSGNLTLIATAISELARNILLYARSGELTLALVHRNGRVGVTVVARDRGPGIPDIDRALEVGYSTSGSLGLGLPGVKRLMDEFEVESRIGEGTIVTVKKWRS
jgi:serine/threonine-protein kinase RsbT